MNRLVDIEVPVLHAVARAHAEEGEHIVLQHGLYTDRPHSRVTSLSPFEEERYGILRNRAPRLVGPVAVHGFKPLNGLWPGAVVSPMAKYEDEPEQTLYVVGFTPQQYKAAVDTMLTV